MGETSTDKPSEFLGNALVRAIRQAVHMEIQELKGELNGNAELLTPDELAERLGEKMDKSIAFSPMNQEWPECRTNRHEGPTEDQGAHCIEEGEGAFTGTCPRLVCLGVRKVRLR